MNNQEQKELRFQELNNKKDKTTEEWIEFQSLMIELSQASMKRYGFIK